LFLFCLLSSVLWDHCFGFQRRVLFPWICT
jgi:hypothetical protein